MDAEDLLETIAQTHAYGPTGIVGREVAARIITTLATRGYTFQYQAPAEPSIDPMIEQAGG